MRMEFLQLCFCFLPSMSCGFEETIAVNAAMGDLKLIIDRISIASYS